MVGEAAAKVRSVTAVLADGRTYPGAVTTGRGLPGVVWAVGYPWSAGFPYTRGAHLVFRDASGKQVAVIDPHAPAGPRQTAQPAGGGVALFSYPASHGEPAGTVQAYLIRGEVAFWSPTWGGAISQRAAAGRSGARRAHPSRSAAGRAPPRPRWRLSATRTPAWRGWCSGRAARNWPPSPREVAGLARQ